MAWTLIRISTIRRATVSRAARICFSSSTVMVIANIRFIELRLLVCNDDVLGSV